MTAKWNSHKLCYFISEKSIIIYLKLQIVEFSGFDLKLIYLDADFLFVYLWRKNVSFQVNAKSTVN